MKKHLVGLQSGRVGRTTKPPGRYSDVSVDESREESPRPSVFAALVLLARNATATDALLTHAPQHLRYVEDAALRPDFHHLLQRIDVCAASLRDVLARHAADRHQKSTQYHRYGIFGGLDEGRRDVRRRYGFAALGRTNDALFHGFLALGAHTDIRRTDAEPSINRTYMHSWYMSVHPCTI